MDHLTALQVFRATAGAGSFAAAARQLGLSPAAVSKNIAELEAHLKVRLINRTTRQMSLTEAGAAYHARLSRILDELAEADAALAPMQGGVAGTLRVSAPLTFALSWVTAAVPRFLAQHPKLRLELKLQDTRTDIVAEGYDLALRGSDRLEDSSLVARELMAAELAFLTALALPTLVVQEGGYAIEAIGDCLDAFLGGFKS